jgi:hypothetical protein
MKTFIKIIFVLMLTVTANIVNSYASTDSVIISIDTAQVHGCSDSTAVNVKIKNDSALYTVISIHMAQGVQWTSLTYHDSVSMVSGSSGSNPMFYVILPDSTDSISFTYYVHGECGVITDIPSLDTDSVYIQNYYHVSVDSFSLSHIYWSNSPQLTYLYSENMFDSAYFGQTFIRMLYFENTGTYNFIEGEFDFHDQLLNGHTDSIIAIWAKVDSSITLIPIVYQIDSLHGEFKAMLPDMAPNDYLEIWEEIIIVGCLENGNGNSAISLNYGCDSILCKTDTTSAVIVPDIRQPNPYFYVLNNNYNDDNCSGSTKHWTVIIGNTSDVPAVNFNFYLQQSHYQLYPYAEEISYTLIYADSTRINYGVNSQTNLLDTIRTLIDTTIYYYDPACYSAIHNHGLFSGYYLFDTLRKNDTVLIDFSTYDCCPDDMHTFNAATIPNSPEYFFNRVSFDYYYHAACPNNSNGSYDWIFPYNHYYNSGLQLLQEYEPLVLDMNGSATQWVNVELEPFYVTNLSYHYNSSYLLDSFYNISIQQGYFKIKLLLDRGLSYDSGSFYISNWDDSYTLHPYMVLDTIIPRDNSHLNDTIAGGYRDSINAYFRLDSFPNLSSLSSFLEDSRINFQLYSYCPANDPHSRYSIQTFLNNDSNCTTCLIPLNKQDGEIFVLCPGCHTPGFQAISYSIQRTNIGLKDSDNDGIPDYPNVSADTNEINRHRAIVGDTIVSTLYADIVNGDEISFNYLYDTLGFTPFQYCYLFSNFSNAPSLSILDVQVIITFDSSGYRVTDILDGLNSIVDSNNTGTTFLYDLSLATLHSFGLTQYTQYSDSDAFTVITKYKVTGNNVTTYGFQETDIHNVIYLTGQSQTLSEEPDTIEEASILSDPLRPKELYWCVAADGYFYFYDIRVQNASTIDDAVSHDPCVKLISANIVSEIGAGSGERVFPYEYRVPSYPDSILIRVPHGYKRDNTYSELRYHYYHFPDTYPDPSFVSYQEIPDTLIFHYINQDSDSVFYFLPKYYDTLRYAPNGNYIHYTDSIPMANELLDYYVYIYISPASCSIVPDTIYSYNNVLDTFIFDHDTTILPTFFFGSMFPFINDSGIIFNAPIIHGPYIVLTVPNKEIEFQNTSPLPYITSDEVCWNFYINDPSTLIPLEYLWAYVEPNAHFTLETAYINATPLFIDTNGIIHLASYLAASGTDYFRICCHYSCGDADSTYSMMLNYGWNCSNYPDSISSPNICNDTAIIFSARQEIATFQTYFIQPDTITNCDIVPFQLVVKAQEGFLYDFTSEVILPPGLSYYSGSGVLVYSDTTLSTVGPHISGDTLRWNLDSTNSVLHTSGLGLGDSLILLFNVQASCGFNGNSSLNAIVTGVPFCGLLFIDSTHTLHGFTVLPCPILLTSISATPILCYGETSTIIASATGGTTPYSYLWNTSQTTDTIIGLPLFNYVVTMTDSGSCNSGSASVTVTQPAAPLTCTPDISPDCIPIGGPPIGKIILTPSGGTPGYTYSWSPVTSILDSIDNLYMGYYFATITDSNGCTLILDSMYVPGAPHDSTWASHDSCNQPMLHNGAVYVLVTGGSPSYTYVWSTTPPQTTSSATGLSAGVYIITVTDSAGCIAKSKVYVDSLIQECDSPLVTSYDTIINGATINTFVAWSFGKILITAPIIIEPGGSLWLYGDTLLMGPSDIIIVERGDSVHKGGFLYLLNSTITNWGSCMWPGIDVQGYDNLPQDSMQGEFAMGYVSGVENAINAVYLGNRAITDTSAHQWAGGIFQSSVDAFGGTVSYFKNNTRGITYPYPYPRDASYPYTSVGYMYANNFISDRDLYDPCYTRPLWFVNIKNTNDVRLFQNSFQIYKDSLNFDVQDTTFGIVDTNSIFNNPLNDGIIYNVFQNVNKAIDITYTIPETTGNNIFGDTIHYSQAGIRIKGGVGNIIRGNSITDKPLYTYSGNNYGIITDSSQQIYVRDNIIDSLEYGITVNNSFGTFNSRIWNNTVSNCRGYGIGTGGNNSNGSQTQGLTVYCNELDTNTIGWSAYDSPPFTFILPAQGICSGSAATDYPPGNIFNHTGPNMDINNNGSTLIVYNVGFNNFSFLPYSPNPTVNVTVVNCGSDTVHGGNACENFNSEAKYAQQIKDSLFNTNSWLGNAYPNPFNNFTEIPYFIPSNCTKAEIDIFDALGNKLGDFPLTVKGVQTTLKISSETYSEGFYFCTMVVDNGIIGWKKLVIIK